jgi:hypothetical protein
MKVTKSGGTSQAVLSLLEDLRYNVSRLQHSLATHRATQGESWDTVKGRLSMIEARLAGLEVRLSSLSEEEWVAIQPDDILRELQQIGRELSDTSREVNDFLDALPQ